MTKKKEKAKQKLMPQKEVTVKSRAYGVHTRAARGSKTPIAINDALKENVARTAAINGVAKRVHDLLKIAGAHFKEAMLWQKMLSRMRKAPSVEMADLLAALKGMELNEKYPLRRFTGMVLLRVKHHKDSLTVNLKPMVLQAGKSTGTQYGYELWLLALGKKAKDDAIAKQQSVWMDKETKTTEVEFMFEVPPKMKHYLLCLHFMCGNEDRATGTLASRGMGIVEMGGL